MRAEVINRRGIVVKALLDRLQAGAANRDHRATAKAIHDFIREHRSDVLLVDEVLQSLDPSTVTACELVSLLIETRPMSAQLPGRGTLRSAAAGKLSDDVGHHEAERTLRFL